MKPQECSTKIGALSEQLLAIENHRRELEAAQANLALPALDKPAVAALDDFEKVFETATNPQKKHLLDELVKEVRVQSTRSGTPSLNRRTGRHPPTRFAHSHIWLLR